MNTLISDKQEEINRICKQNHVKCLYTFGSINTDDFNLESDIDFIVSFDMSKISTEDYVEMYFTTLYELENLFKREIDLVTERSIKNPYFKEEIMDKRVLVYESELN